MRSAIVRGLVLVVALATCSIQLARSQELNPRAYVISPLGSNAISVAYAYLQGNFQFDGAVPITGAKADISLPALGLYHSFGFLGRSANVAVGVPYGDGNFAGTVADVPRFAHRSGSFDSTVRLSVNLLGGPAMPAAEFAHWRENVLLGVSLKIVAPTGQYDPTRVVNFGNNRWAFKTELGYSQRWGNWVLDGYAGGWFFTTNPEYFPGTVSLSESPVVAFETHLSYNVALRSWVSLDANFWSGGADSMNGLLNRLTNQKSSRVGATAQLAISAHQAIKLSYSSGAYVSYGGSYQSVSASWQYSWVWPR